MNLDFLRDSFGNNYPEENDGTIDCGGYALTCSFNRWGSLLAIGCNDGKVAIVDFITRGVVKVLAAHVSSITSLSWSRNGRKLLASSTDNTVTLWDLKIGECENRFRFSAAAMKVQFNPRKSTEFLVFTLKNPAVLMNTNGAIRNIPAEDDQGIDPCVTGSFDRRGQYIFTGNSKGKISVFKSDTLQLVTSFRMSSSHAIKAIVFAKKGESFIINSADRIIRVYDTREVLQMVRKDPEPLQKLQDLVNKTPWISVGFSGFADYVFAGSGKSHAIYIWERNSGSLVKILHGTKGEQLLEVAWHPARPVLCSISTAFVSVWSQSHVENWSAFAPDFKELDENVEYEERESEFDVEDEDRSEVDNNEQLGEEDFDVDVETAELPAAFCSSDEEGEDPEALRYLSVAPDVDEPEENPFSHLVADPAITGQQFSPGKNSPTKTNSSSNPTTTFAVPFDVGQPLGAPAPAQFGASNKKRPSTGNAGGNGNGNAWRPLPAKRQRSKNPEFF